MPDPVTPAPATVSRTGTPSGRVDVPGGHVSGPVGWVRGYWFSALVVVTIGFLVVAEISDGPDAAADWNWLMHTGAIVFLVALAAARAIPPAVPLAVRRIRLVDDEGVERAHGDEVLAALELVRRRCARIGAPVGLVLMGMFWLWAGGNRVWGNALFWLELAAAAGAGFIVGGFVAYGRLGHVLNTLGLRALAIPGHPDGAAGLRPVGAFYLRQAMIIALIGVFAGVWWLLFPYVGHYDNWRQPYLGIVLVCVVLEAAALFLPLSSFHRHMQQQRIDLLRVADEAAASIARADELIWRTFDDGERAALEAERKRALDRWQAIDSMPTWPVDVQIRRRFAWSNVAMLIPVVLQIINAPQILQQITSALAGL